MSRERLHGIVWIIERPGDAAEDVASAHFVESEARAAAERLGDPWNVKAYDFSIPAPEVGP